MNATLVAATTAHAPAAHATIVPHPIATALVKQAAQIPVAVQPQTWFQAHASWATHGVAGIFVLAAVGLVILLAVQTTKQEGLSGTIGGRVESAYRGRMGADEQLQRLTAWVAGAFVVTGFFLSLTGI